MVALLFRTNTVRQQCCDLGHMRASWGAAVARCISRRLQQLEAMSTLDDLASMPFDSYTEADGRILVTITPELALAIEPTPEASESATPMPSITVNQVLATSTAVQQS